MPIFDHFDWLAPHYDRLISSSHREIWMRLLDPKPGSLLLDAGGGTGRVVERMDCSWCWVMVADASFKMLRQAAEKPGLAALQSFTENLPFSSNSIDRVIMVDALHHVDNQAVTISELFRILKPGGILVIEEPDIRHFRVKLIAVAEKLALMRSHFLSPQKIGSLFQGLPAQVSMEYEDLNVFVIIRKSFNGDR
jgi:demethylmenaquinone methyltransferase/2-methoxy-6-polyprenyl-1,4-benzoquinol methylase